MSSIIKISPWSCVPRGEVLEDGRRAKVWVSAELFPSILCKREYPCSLQLRPVTYAVVGVLGTLSVSSVFPWACLIP